MQHEITVMPVAAIYAPPTPPAASEPLDDTVVGAGASVFVNGVEFDLSTIPDGGEGVPEGEHPFVGPILRVGDVLRYKLLVRYDARTAAAIQTRTNWTVTLQDEVMADLFDRRPSVTITDVNRAPTV